ncbi:MAG: hypothetical protein M1348_03020 [Candidatus Parvarchaeota archaeon]|nr:hypothetical protein [Candidatus Parvarchaeota archaeon]MCL5101556.1 hypothetical protein [Candidatus Parvarchaeota archaeon]
MVRHKNRENIKTTIIAIAAIIAVIIALLTFLAIAHIYPFSNGVTQPAVNGALTAFGSNNEVQFNINQYPFDIDSQFNITAAVLSNGNAFGGSAIRNLSQDVAPGGWAQKEGNNYAVDTYYTAPPLFVFIPFSITASTDLMLTFTQLTAWVKISNVSIIKYPNILYKNYTAPSYIEGISNLTASLQGSGNYAIWLKLEIYRPFNISTSVETDIFSISGLLKNSNYSVSNFKIGFT